MSYLAKDDPRALLAQYKNGDDSESDSIESFVDWLENEWDSGLTSTNEEKRIQMIMKVINEYVDYKRPMIQFEVIEQKKLRDWISAVKGEENEI